MPGYTVTAVFWKAQCFARVRHWPRFSCPEIIGRFIVPVEFAITIDVLAGNALGIAALVVTRAVRELPISFAVRLKGALPDVVLW